MTGADPTAETFPCLQPGCRGTFVRVEGRSPGGRPRRYCGSRCRRLAARDAQWAKAEAEGRARGYREGREEAKEEAGEERVRYADLVAEATALVRRWDGTIGPIRKASRRRDEPLTDAQLGQMLRDGLDAQMAELWQTIRRLSAD